MSKGSLRPERARCEFIELQDVLEGAVGLAEERDGGDCVDLRVFRPKRAVQLGPEKVEVVEPIGVWETESDPMRQLSVEVCGRVSRKVGEYDGDFVGVPGKAIRVSAHVESGLRQELFQGGGIGAGEEVGDADLGSVAVEVSSTFGQGFQRLGHGSLGRGV